MIPKHDIQSIVDNIGMPISGINVAYGNSGTIGVIDTDILITLDPDVGGAHRRLHPHAARTPAARVSGTTFSFLPADIVSQILNFGLPAPIDVQVVGNKAEENRAYAEKIFRRIARVPGVADPRIQQVFNNPTLDVDVDRSLANQIGLTEGRTSPATCK